MNSSVGYPLVGAGGSRPVIVTAGGSVATAVEVTPKSVRDEESQQGVCVCVYVCVCMCVCANPFSFSVDFLEAV